MLWGDETLWCCSLRVWCQLRCSVPVTHIPERPLRSFPMAGMALGGPDLDPSPCLAARPSLSAGCCMGPCLSLPTRRCRISIFLDTQDGQSWGGTVLLIEPGTGSPGTAPCAGRGDAVALASSLPPPSLPCSILALPALPVPPAVPFALGPPAHRALLAPALHGDMGASPQWVASVNRVPHRWHLSPSPGQVPAASPWSSRASAPLSSSSSPSSSRGRGRGAVGWVPAGPRAGSRSREGVNGGKRQREASASSCKGARAPASTGVSPCGLWV